MFETTCKYCGHTYHFNNRGERRCPNCTEDQELKAVVGAIIGLVMLMAFMF